MLVTAQITLALRCPHCGKLDFHSLSRFSCSGRSAGKIHCECGTCLLIVSQKRKALFHLQVECVMCETKHVLSFTGNELWKTEVLAIKCENTGVEIGFLGHKETVLRSAKRVDRSLREIAEDLGYDKYFVNPDIMYQVLDLLRKMTDEGRMSCACGSSELELEVYSDRVELLCPSCDAEGIVFSETVKDLQWAHDMGAVHLEAHAYQYLNRKRLKKKNPLKK